MAQILLVGPILSPGRQVQGGGWVCSPPPKGLEGQAEEDTSLGCWVGCSADVPKEYDKSLRGTLQVPVCTARVASEAWIVTASGTSLAGRFDEIQVALS